jgi:hypothetical protein
MGTGTLEVLVIDDQGRWFAALEHEPLLRDGQPQVPAVDHPPVGRDPEPRLEVGAGVVGEDGDNLAGTGPETLQGRSERFKARADGRALARPRKRSVHVSSFPDPPQRTPGGMTVPNGTGQAWTGHAW